MAKTRKKKPGPKPLSPDKKRGSIICVKVTRAERDYLRYEAKRLRVSVSAVLMQPHRDAMAGKG